MVADILKRPHYKAGDTLRLIVPFLKAYDVTDNKMHEFARRNLVLVRNSKETLRHIGKSAYAFIVSTSYEHYIRAVCVALGFPFENTYCTRLKIDHLSILDEEKTVLKKTAEEITQMQQIRIPPEAESLKDFSPNDRETIRLLDDIFWKEMAGLKIGKAFSEVDPIGGTGKADAVSDIVNRFNQPIENVLYVGDSITDQEAFRLVRNEGGLAVSFNGNQYAVKNADIAVLSETGLVTAVIASIFFKDGKQAALDFARTWSRRESENDLVDKSLGKGLFRMQSLDATRIEVINSDNIIRLCKESSEFRKKVRGEAAGRIG